jgi:hypothetical protein
MAAGNLTQAWTTASASLPLEWRLMCVVLGPREVAPVIRSESWLAWAVGPNGERAEGLGSHPAQALLDLATKLQPLRGNRNG